MNAAKVLTWPLRRRRSWKKDAWFIAGMAGAGLALGALKAGRRGAAIGALSGGVGRLIYRLAGR